MTESHDTRLRRLWMRSIRRGTKEMDIILTRYAKARLDAMNVAELDIYDALLHENDQDLYQWVTGQHPAPEAFRLIVQDIADHSQKAK